MDARITIRVPEELFEMAREKAEREDVTVSQILRRALRKWVDEDPPEQEQRDEPGDG